MPLESFFKGCNVFNNRANWGAGLHSTSYYGEPSITLELCSIFANSANNGGGGIFTENGAITMDNCVIYQNSACCNHQPNGGGVYAQNGLLNFKATRLYSNTAAVHGGGIFADDTYGPTTPILDAYSAAWDNQPDGCYGFWSTPACNNSLSRLTAALREQI